MTLQITSFDHGLEVALATVKKIDTLGFQFVMAGGFLRDIDHGVQPKDMDLFFRGVPNGAGQTGTQGIDAAAKAVFDLLGHTYKKFTADTENEYPNTMVVFESVEVPDGDFPVNLMFTAPGTSHPIQFDIGLCNIQLYKANDLFMVDGERWRIHRDWMYANDEDNKTLTVHCIHDQYTLMYSPDVPEFEPAMVRFLGHMRRVMAKYPDYTPTISLNYLDQPEGAQVYERLIQENIFGDPRTLLPAERQAVDWDEFRQPDREEGLGQVELNFARGEAGPDLVQATLDRIQRRAQVQPRFVVEDDVEVPVAATPAVAPQRWTTNVFAEWNPNAGRGVNLNGAGA